MKNFTPTTLSRKNLTAEEKSTHEKFSEFGKNAKLWMRKCVLLLPKINKSRIWEKKGFGSIYEYAAKLAGMSRYTVNDSLRIIEKLNDKPELLKVAQEKGLNSIRPVLSIVTKETEKFWAKKAVEMSKNTLAVYVRDFKNENFSEEKFGNPTINKFGPGTGSPTNNGLLEPNLFQENKSSKVQISMKLDAEIFEELKKIKGEGDWNEAMKKLLRRGREALEEEQKRATEVELEAQKPKPIKTSIRTIPTAIKSYVMKRSKGICEQKNCKNAGRHFHHTIPFALKKEHDPDKIRFLCEQHHSIAHCGLIENEEKTPETWRILRFPDLTDFKSVINARVADFRKTAAS